MSKLCCKSCQSQDFVKNGFVKEKQRYRCKECGCQFTDTPKRGVPDAVKKFCIYLYAHCGVSQNKISILAGVSPPAVLKWIKKAALSVQPTEKKAKSDIICLDEMWHFVNGKKTKLGSGGPWMGCLVRCSDGKLVLVRRGAAADSSKKSRRQERNS